MIRVLPYQSAAARALNFDLRAALAARGVAVRQGSGREAGALGVGAVFVVLDVLNHGLGSLPLWAANCQGILDSSIADLIT